MIDDLANKHCVPCEGGTPPLAREQAVSFLARVPGWSLADDALSISHTFEFKDFKQALAFMNRVGELAESEGHHPDIHNFWNKVRLDFSTHAVKGLSENDFILAAKINGIEKPR
jgi:4a-hydroxytetrahydrobiopterin dehydratase